VEDFEPAIQPTWLKGDKGNELPRNGLYVVYCLKVEVVIQDNVLA